MFIDVFTRIVMMFAFIGFVCFVFGIVLFVLHADKYSSGKHIK